MRHILVVEGNTEELVTIDANGNINGAAEHYAACLNTLADDLHFSITRPHFTHDPSPQPDWDTIDAYVFTGAGVSWSASDDEAAPVRDVMATALATQKPVFGSCYGFQIGVAVIGGHVGANPAGPELAIARHVTVNDAGRGHPLYNAKTDQFDALCMHRDDVLSVDPSLEVLSSNNHTQIQAAASKTDEHCFWGVQYHPEFTYESIVNVLKRPSLESFENLQSLEHCLGLQISSISHVIEDFTKLANGYDDGRLAEHYRLDDSITNLHTHRRELTNWLDLVMV